MVTMLRPRNLLRPAVRYPADPRAVFILALSVFSGVGTLLAQAGPGTLEAVLPRWGVIVWGVTLALGSFVALAGLSRDTDNGIIAEQIGSVMVGVACIYYSAIALYTVGVTAFQVVGIVLAWGLACLLRWYQLQLLIHTLADERLTAQVHTELRRQADED